LRARVLALFAAVTAAAPLAAQQEQRVVRELSFQGNHALDDYTLSTAIATSRSSAFARLWWLRWAHLGEKKYLNETEFRRDVLRLLLLFRRSGYVNVVIDTIVRRTDRDAFITFRINEGGPVNLTRLDIVGAESLFNLPQLKKELPLQVGRPFSRILLQASADTIVGRLYGRGFPYAQVLRNFDENDASLSAEATLEVLPGPRMRIGEVAILGLQRLDTAIIRDLLRVKPHDQFRRDLLYRTQRDLYALGVFRSVSVLLEDSLAPATPGDSTVRVAVHLREGPGHRVFGGVGYGTIDCFRVQSGWTAYNFLGGLRALDLTGSVSKLGVGAPVDLGFANNACQTLASDFTSDTLNYSVGLTLRQPTFFSPRHTARLSVFAERRSEYRAYTREDVGINPSVTINARRDVPVIAGYVYTVGRTTAAAAVYCSVFKVCNAADQALLGKSRPFAALTLTGVRNGLNSILDPTTGGLATLGLMYASRWVGSDTLYEFSRVEGEVSRYYSVGRRSVLAWRLRAGRIFPARHIALEGQSVQFVPPDQRFYGGGPNSVRGYPRNGLGPRVYVSDQLTVSGAGDSTFSNVTSSPTGGSSVVVLNTEVRLATPIFPGRMRVALFVDAGQVWVQGGAAYDFRGIRITPGAGLRFTTPLGPVRVDAAYNGYLGEPGPLYYLNKSDSSLTLIPGLTYQPARPPGFWRRVVIQFSVGQAF
jgi:outer membrane protein assembly complex protein YaeT